jgi:hypothetical protein
MSEAPMLMAEVALCKLPFFNKSAYVNFAETASEEDKLNHAKLIALREQIAAAASHLKVGDMVWAEMHGSLFKGRIIVMEPHTFYGGITSIKFTLEITEPGKVFSKRHISTSTTAYASDVEAVSDATDPTSANL